MVCKKALIGVMVVGLGLGSAARADAQSAADLAYKESLLAQKQSLQGIVATPLGGNYCLTGNTVETHDLGLLPAFTNVQIRFQSNFDPVAAAMLLRVGLDSVNTDPTRESDARWIDDDDSGGNLEPLLNFQTPHAGSLFVYVAQFGSTHGLAAKCYDIEVTLTPPLGTTTAQ